LVLAPCPYSDPAWRPGEVVSTNRLGHGLVSVRPLGMRWSSTWAVSQLRSPEEARRLRLKVGCPK
jgi:hypothetical protein